MRGLIRQAAASRAAGFSALILAAVSLSSCASKILKHKDEATLQDHQDFDQAVKIEDMPAAGAGDAWKPGQYVLKTASNATAALSGLKAGSSTESGRKGRRGRKGKSAVQDAKSALPKIPAPPGAPAGVTEERLASNPRIPEIEDSEGFVGRRPVSDPFRVGEKVTLELSYFGVVAGDLEMEVGNFAQVNGRKSYRFLARARSRSVFAMVYAVDDWAEAFLDFQSLAPSTYALHVKESKQLREQRMYFDWTSMTANFWDKRITKENGVEEKRQKWEAQAFAQTIFTGPFYLRTFRLVPGKKLAFRVANEGNNYVFTGEVLRRETIDTIAGEFKTVVVKPQIQLAGVFQPMGDILFWLTDDDRKFFVRIESKIKIGTIKGVAKEIVRGAP